jgi:hypothetical protein
MLEQFAGLTSRVLFQNSHLYAREDKNIKTRSYERKIQVYVECK